MVTLSIDQELVSQKISKFFDERTEDKNFIVDICQRANLTTDEINRFTNFQADLFGECFMTSINVAITNDVETDVTREDDSE